jgi:hypothetical protein
VSKPAPPASNAPEIERLRSVNATMLKALKYAQDWVEDFGSDYAIRLVRAAIKKAEGR